MLSIHSLFKYFLTRIQKTAVFTLAITGCMDQERAQLAIVQTLLGTVLKIVSHGKEIVPAVGQTTNAQEHRVRDTQQVMSGSLLLGKSLKAIQNTSFVLMRYGI